MKYSTKDKVLYEYDENGNLVHIKYSNEKEEWNEYDEKGNKILSKVITIKSIRNTNFNSI